MLASVFSLQGRIGRLQFFVGDLLLTIVSPAFFLAVMVVGPGLADPRPHADAPYVLIAIATMVLAAAAIWLAISLHARRVRDIGWSPRLIVAGWLVFKIIAAVVSIEMSTQGTGRALRIGLVFVDYGFWLILLLVPGRTDDDTDEAAPRPPQRDALDRRPAPGPAKGFGRRGTQVA